MWMLARYAIFLLVIATTAVAAEVSRDTPADGLRYKAVLIAGDPSSPVFDHATEAMRERLLERRVAPPDIETLSAAVVARDGVRSASLDHVLAAIDRLRPGAGEGCLVFATSHGAFREGLVLMPSANFLTPAALDGALTTGCGNAPTVVIISGCYSGGFTKGPMARANRIVLTAAREDRPSFGCGTGFQYTVYDRCLLRAMDISATWRAAYDTIRQCVADREKAFHFRPSEPRGFFGEAVKEMSIPPRS
jgi:hypothetical protein